MKMIQTMSMAFGFRVPVYPKISGSTSAKSVLNNLVRNPYASALLIDGVDGGTGHVIEYRGEAITALDMEARMTICNMSIEAGARAGMIAMFERLGP